jgi:hypothetical protein
MKTKPSHVLRPGAQAILALCCVAVATAGCGNDTVSRQTAAAGQSDGPPPGARSKPNDQPQELARVARLAAGAQDFVLLALPEIGQLLVSCDAAEGPSVAFRADARLPTSDVVVSGTGATPEETTLQPERRYQPTPASSALLQTWHIAPFASANVRLTAISVAARRLSQRDPWDCAASAKASVSPSQGATRTRQGG